MFLFVVLFCTSLCHSRCEATQAKIAFSVKASVQRLVLLVAQWFVSRKNNERWHKLSSLEWRYMWPMKCLSYSLIIRNKIHVVSSTSRCDFCTIHAVTSWRKKLLVKLITARLWPWMYDLTHRFLTVETKAKGRLSLRTRRFRRARTIRSPFYGRAKIGATAKKVYWKKAPQPPHSSAFASIFARQRKERLGYHNLATKTTVRPR